MNESTEVFDNQEQKVSNEDYMAQIIFNTMFSDNIFNITDDVDNIELK